MRELCEGLRWFASQQRTGMVVLLWNKLGEGVLANCSHFFCLPGRFDKKRLDRRPTWWGESEPRQGEREKKKKKKTNTN
jgi:hypothetical protein